MSNLYTILDRYLFSGLPSELVAEVIKTIWSKLNQKSWEELYLEAFVNAIKNSRKQLEKYTDNGDIDLDKSKLKLVLQQDLGVSISRLKYSEIISLNFITDLAQAMESRSAIIIGGNNLTHEDYQNIIQNLIAQVNGLFKKSILANELAFKNALLDETLTNQEIALEIHKFQKDKFDGVEIILDTIIEKIDSIQDSVIKVNIPSVEGYFEIHENYYFVADTFKWIATSQMALEKIEKVYVGEPVDKLLSSLSERRVVIVSGENQSGRYSLSLKIANYLKKERGIEEIYTLRLTADSSTLIFLLDRRLPRNCVFLLRNAFDSPGFNRKDFEEATLEINNLLEEQGSYILLTCDSPISLPPDLFLIDNPGLTNSQKIDVLYKHISSGEYLIDNDIKKALTNKPTLVKKVVKILDSPYNINQFIGNIAREPEEREGVEDYLINLAKNIAGAASTIEDWWTNKISDLEKYLAMTIVLFPELNLRDLLKRFQIDNSIMQELRSELEKPLDHDLDHYLKTLNCFVSGWGTLEYRNQHARSFVLDQLRQNYFFHYWKLADIYAKEVENHPSRDDIEVRLSYSRALGEIGKSNFEDLAVILERWGNSNLKSIQAATGYALQQVCIEPASRIMVEELIRKWARDGSRELKWTAIAAAERLYTDIPECVREVINVLSSDFQVSHAIIHAIRKISRVTPDEAVSMILAWFEIAEMKNNSIQVRLAINTSYRIIEGFPPRSQIRRKAIMPLVEKLLLYSEETRIKAMQILQVWLMKDNTQSCINDVGELLASILSRNETNIVESIIDELVSNWYESENNSIHQIARDLIEFMNLDDRINGILKGIIIIDLSENDDGVQGKLWENYEDVVTRFSDNSIFDLYSLGNTHLQKGSIDTLKSLIALRPNRIRPVRLLVPILEKYDLDQIDFVIVITSGNIIDLEDIISTGWAKILIINLFRKDIEIPPGITTVYFASGKQLEFLAKKWD